MPCHQVLQVPAPPGRAHRRRRRRRRRRRPVASELAGQLGADAIHADGNDGRLRAGPAAGVTRQLHVSYASPSGGTCGASGVIPWFYTESVIRLPGPQVWHMSYKRDLACESLLDKEIYRSYMSVTCQSRVRLC